MSEEIRCWEYVNRSYPKVGDALVAGGASLFERATTAAVGRAKELVSTLHVSLGGFDVGREVVVHVRGVDRKASVPRMASEATCLDLEWTAHDHPGLFPKMHAKLIAYPLGSGETQLELRGSYDPPGGAVGTAIDRVAGHRIAEASVHRFLTDVAERLSRELV